MLLISTALFIPGILLLAIGIHGLRTAIAAASWPIVPAVITASAAKHLSSSEGVSYQPCVKYAYEIGGKKYLGSTLFPGFEAIYDREKTASYIAEMYAVGSKVYVSVDPQNPTRSIVEPKSRGHIYTQLALGSLLLFIAIRLSFRFFW